MPEAGRHYAERRNFDGGPGHRANVSGLSPWIRHRLVREDEVVAAALARHGDPAAEKCIQEVVWRTYWKRWLEQRPTVWTRYRAAVVAGLDALERELDLRARWEQATTGCTGLACFDAWGANSSTSAICTTTRACGYRQRLQERGLVTYRAGSRPHRPRRSAGSWRSGMGTNHPRRACGRSVMPRAVQQAEQDDPES